MILVRKSNPDERAGAEPDGLRGGAVYLGRSGPPRKCPANDQQRRAERPESRRS